MASNIISLQLFFCVKFTRFWWLSTKFRKQMQIRTLMDIGCVPPACWPYPSMHWAGGCIHACMCVCVQAYTGQDGCLPRGCLPRGCVSQHALGRGVCTSACTGQGCLSRRVSTGGRLPRGLCVADTPLWTEWQTGVKTLPCRHFVACGKKRETNRTSRLEMPPFLICNHYG